MNFRSENKFNTIVNTLSGNFFPLTGEKSSLSVLRLTYMIFVSIFKTIYVITTAIGCFSYVPAMEAIRDGGVTAIVSIEVIILSIYLNLRRDFLRVLIKKINSALVDSDDLRRIIRDTVVPYKNRMKVYTIATLGSVVMWAALPVLKVLETDTFTYTDYVLATYFPGAPFDVKAFVCGIIVDVVGSSYVIFNKNAIDIYVTYLITILTAEFRYVNEKITHTLSENNNKSDDRSVIVALRECVHHHCILIDIGQMLTKLLNLNVVLTYMNCVLRFCLLGFCLIATPGAYFAKCIYMVFTLGNLVQVYFLCSCAQELLDASSSMTDNAFHEGWYNHSNFVKDIFRTMGLSSRMECRLTGFQIVDMTVPSFAASKCGTILRIPVAALALHHPPSGSGQRVLTSSSHALESKRAIKHRMQQERTPKEHSDEWFWGRQSCAFTPIALHNVNWDLGVGVPLDAITSNQLEGETVHNQSRKILNHAYTGCLLLLNVNG